jgi:hypothetical protein
MGRDEPGSKTEQALARLSAATKDLSPDDGLTDAVMAAVGESRPAGDALSVLARATSSLDVRDDFSDAVMARVARERVAPPPSWLDGVVRSGPIAIGLAVFAAAASFLIFTSSQSDLDVVVASSVDTVEVDE